MSTEIYSNISLSEAIDKWNNPKTLFTSTFCTIFGHTRAISMAKNTTFKNFIDKFTLEDFADKTDRDKEMFCQLVKEEMEGVKIMSKQIAEEVDKMIIERIKENGTF